MVFINYFVENFIMTLITRNIERLRDVNKISQTELATKIGMTQTGLSQALKKGDFKISTLQKIAEAFEVDIGLLFSKSELSNMPARRVRKIAERIRIKREQEFLKELEKQRVFYETIIKNREAGIYRYHSISKAFYTIIEDLLTGKINEKDININKLEAVRDRFFGIDIIEMYSIDTTELKYDYKDWLKKIIAFEKEDSTKEYYKKKNDK